MFAGARRLLSRILISCTCRASRWLCVWLAGIASAAPVAADITAARFTDPTTRYAHGVLGDAIEYGALEMTLRGGKRVSLTLPEQRVFEDLAPRLADVDGDGTNEVVVVESSLSAGARLAVYDETGLRAATPHIGQSNRWLAPIGVADLDGDGHVEIAYIDRPHLARTLRVWRFVDNTLTEVGDLKGLTNHRIGQDFISGGIRDCGAGPEMITVDADWRNVMASTFDGTKVQTRAIAGFTGQNALKAALACDGG